MIDARGKHRDAGLHRYASPSGLDGDQKLHSRQHPDRRRHGHAERATELFRERAGRADGTTGFARHYRPQDVYISELFGGLSQLDNGVTTVHDISQIHHSPQHSDAAVKGLIDAGRRGVLGYFESAGNVAGNQYPTDATRIKQQLVLVDRSAHHHDHGRRGLSRQPTYTQSWTIGRQLGLQIAAHILSPFGIRPILDDLAAGTGGTDHNIGLGSDNLFIHMTGMSDFGWQKVKDRSARRSRSRSRSR